MSNPFTTKPFGSPQEDYKFSSIANPPGVGGDNHVHGNYDGNNNLTGATVTTRVTTGVKGRTLSFHDQFGPDGTYLGSDFKFE